MLWGLAKQDAKRHQLVTGKGQLFKTMADRLVAQAGRIMPGEGLPINFSMLIWSLGTLNFHPGMPPPPQTALPWVFCLPQTPCTERGTLWGSSVSTLWGLGHIPLAPDCPLRTAAWPKSALLCAVPDIYGEDLSMAHVQGVLLHRTCKTDRNPEHPKQPHSRDD